MSQAPRTDLPTGTVTFLRTDVEGSMALAGALRGGWDELNATQMAIVRSAVESHGGVAVRTEGDAVFAVFAEAVPAMLAAIELQERIAGHPWPDGARVRVRVGLHTGQAHRAGDDYGGFEVNRAARIAAVGHGGQIVLSDPTRALVEGELPGGAAIRDLGRHALKDVPQPERLFQLDVPGQPTVFPPLRTTAAASGNLPPRLTSFVARDGELAELGRLLETSRLVTITGPGGIGKTSLGIELARRRAAEFPDGAWLVPLEAVTDPALVPTTIARTLSIFDGPGRPMLERLGDYLARHRLILVLDNFEHLLDAAASVAELLRAAQELRIVVTSRSPLHVAGEQEYPLGTLAGDDRPAASDAPSPAARLFAERASAVRPGWQPGADAAVVEEICRLVDGLPLGIELAAARIAVLPPVAIRDRLAARLPLPGSGPRDVPTRQRTLDGTIAWSFDLLAPAQQRLLGELAVFEGGFDLEQVRAAATLEPGEDPLDALVELVDRSLVARSALSGHESGLGSLRFRMLETIRSYALRRIAEDGTEPAARRRHALAVLDLVERAATHLPSADQARWLDRLGQDHGNLGVALRWSVEAGEVELAQRLAWAGWRYWQLGGHIHEGRALTDAVVDMPRADEPSPGRMWSIAAAGNLAYWQADLERARPLYRRQLEVARQIGDRAGEADACFNLAATEFIASETAASVELLDRARGLYQELGDEVGAGRIEWSRTNIGLMGEDPWGAVATMRDLHRRYAEKGDVMYEALASGSLAFGLFALGERREAMEWGLVTLRLHHALRDVASSTLSLVAGAIILASTDRKHETATIMGAFEGLCALHGVRPPAGIGQLILNSRVEEQAIEALSSGEYAAAAARGRAMTIDEAIAFAIAVLEAELAADQPAAAPESENRPA